MTDKVMYLNDKKVLKHFGKWPQLGKRMFWAPSMTKRVGIRYVFGRPTKEGNKVEVYPTCALHPLGQGKWRVECADEYWPKTQMWLVDNCM